MITLNIKGLRALADVSLPIFYFMGRFLECYNFSCIVSVPLIRLCWCIVVSLALCSIYTFLITILKAFFKSTKQINVGLLYWIYFSAICFLIISVVSGSFCICLIPVCIILFLWYGRIALKHVQFIIFCNVCILKNSFVSSLLCSLGSVVDTLHVLVEFLLVIFWILFISSFTLFLIYYSKDLCDWFLLLV